MVLNLSSLIRLLAFQQVFNICLFVTITQPFKLLSMVIHTFENARVLNFYIL
jgi:hypothetical protein